MQKPRLSKSKYVNRGVGVKAFERLYPKSSDPSLLDGMQVFNLSERKPIYGQILEIVKDKDIDEIISFLTSESGSHDYTIYRDEARDELGLNIEKPDDELMFALVLKNLSDRQILLEKKSLKVEITDLKVLFLKNTTKKEINLKTF